MNRTLKGHTERKSEVTTESGGQTELLPLGTILASISQASKMESVFSFFPELPTQKGKGSENKDLEQF